MKRARLSRDEKAVEDALLKGEYRAAPPARLEEVAAALSRRRKDAVLHIRINGADLAGLKRKAKGLGVPYQTLVAELLHRYAA